MGKFTIERVDDATGMQTSLVLEATTQDEALVWCPISREPTFWPAYR